MVESFCSLVQETYGMALQLLLFLPPRDIFRCLCLNRGISRVLQDEVTWKVLYFYLCTSKNSGVISDGVLHEMHRPINRAAVGWRVEYDSRQGVVIDFRINSRKISYKEEYLILYDDIVVPDTEIAIVDDNLEKTEWVAENDIVLSASDRYPSKSKIRFLTPPFEECNAVDCKRNNLADILSSDMLFSASVAEERSMRAFFSALDPPPSSWRVTYKDLLIAMPRHHLATVSVHSDEVLDVCFNHAGNLLAAVSRDGTFSLTQISLPRPQVTSHLVGTTTYSGYVTSHACNVKFSPCDKYLHIVSSDPFQPENGADVEVFSIELNVDRDIMYDSDGNFKPLEGCQLKSDMLYEQRNNDRCCMSLPRSSFSSPPCLKLVSVLHSPFNMSAVWVGDERIVYCNDISFSTRGYSCQTFCCYDVVNHLQRKVHLRVNGNAALATSLRLRPGVQVRNTTETVADDSDNGECFEGDGIVYATNSKNAAIGYPQILCIVPLSAFGVEHGFGQIVPTPTFMYDTYPTVDMKGAIVGITTIAGDCYHDHIFVNVRPHVSEHGEEAIHGVLEDIDQNVEIRVFNASNMQHIFTYNGHHGFTLKDCPFYIFLDVRRRTSAHIQHAKSPDQVFVSSDNPHKNTSSSNSFTHNSLNGALLASGSEDHKVYIWMGKYSSPIQVLDGHTDHVGAVAFNHKIPGMLATASDDTLVHIYCGTAY